MKLYLKNNKFYLPLFSIITAFVFIKSPILNIYFTIISLITIFTLFKHKIIVTDNSLNKILLIFFIYIVFNCLFNYYNNIQPFFKGISQFRFYLIVIALQIFYSQIFKNINYFFLTNLLFSVLIILDMMIQYYTGTNILGFKSQLGGFRVTGIFNEELVAGGYIFAIGFLGLIYFLIKKNFLFFFLFLSFFIMGIILSGDRNPLMMVFLAIFFNLIFNKSLRKYFSYYLLVLVSVVILFINFSEISYNRYIDDIKNSFNKSQPNFATLYWWLDHDKILLEKELLKKDNNYEKIKVKLSENALQFNFVKALENKKKDYDQNIFLQKIFIFGNTNYGAHYLTALEIIKKNIFFGTGIRSFRHECQKYKNDIISYNKNDGCTTHPHNLHLEIISEIGLVGYIIFFCFIFNLFFRSITYNQSNSTNKIVIIFISSLIFAQLFPFKPSGAIFSTWFGSQIWFTIALNCLFLNRKISKRDG